MTRMVRPSANYDVIVVGAGIVGLAHAFAAARAGSRVLVLERDLRACNASIRNFGFVCVTGQESGAMHALAQRSRAIWSEIALAAGLNITQTGLSVLARRPEAANVLETFMATDGAEGCELLSRGQFFDRFPDTPPFEFRSALVSPHDVRIEPRVAIPSLTDWLSERWDIDFLFGTSVSSIETRSVFTGSGKFQAEAIFVCPGNNLSELFPGLAAERGIGQCKLQMLRLAPSSMKLPTVLMSDLSLIRYPAYADLDSTGSLRQKLENEQAAHLSAGVHLIAVQSADGSIILGDSHEYGPDLDPFQRAEIDSLILSEFADLLPSGHPLPFVTERWIGTYPSATDKEIVSDEILPGVHVTVVTSGTGMSIALALAEKIVGDTLNAVLGPIS